MLAEAQRQVVTTFESIGVHVRWTDEDGSVPLVVRDDEPGNLRRPARPLLGVALYAAQGSAAVYVFYRRAAEQADRFGVPRAAVVASTMAHEVGHLLLPDREHAATGLMRGCWDYGEFDSAARGDLRFTPAEASSIRMRLLRR